MSPILQALGIDQMNIDERIALANAIWDSIGEQSHSPLITEPQRQELERRLTEHQANPNDVIPWEQIRADALKRFQK